MLRNCLKDQRRIVSELNNLSQLVNDGKVGYQRAADKTESPEFKALFLKLSGERIVYADELKEHIALMAAKLITKQVVFLAVYIVARSRLKRLLQGMITRR